MYRNALHPDHSITDRFDQSTDHARGGEMEETENKLTKGIASNTALFMMNCHESRHQSASMGQIECNGVEYTLVGVQPPLELGIIPDVAGPRWIINIGAGTCVCYPAIPTSELACMNETIINFQIDIVDTFARNLGPLGIRK